MAIASLLSIISPLITCRTANSTIFPLLVLGISGTLITIEGTFFGEQIALMASNQDSDKISIIENRVKPTKLPTDLLLNIGVYTRLFYERLRATTEI
mgnify:CR=1 FL=1